MKNKLFLVVAFFSFLFLSNSVINAQNAINMTLVKTGPHSSHLDNVDDFLSQIILIARESVGRTTEFNLKITVEGPNDLNIYIEKALNDAVELDANQFITLTGFDMDEYGLLDNVSSDDVNPQEERDYLDRGRVLREGHYIICMTAIENQSPYTELSSPACYEFDIEYGDAPIILNPETNDTIIDMEPPSQFKVAWEHSPIGGFSNIDYKVRIVDLSPYHDSDPNELMDQLGVPSLFEEFYSGVLSVFLDDIDFENGHDYAIRVTAFDPDGEVSFKNGGRSDVVVFTYGKKGNEDDDKPKVMSGDASCFYLAYQLSSNKISTGNLKIGDILKIASFEMKVTDINSEANNTYSGNGEISIPFLNDNKIKVEFSDIQKDKNNIVFAGEANAIKDASFQYEKITLGGNASNAIGISNNEMDKLNNSINQAKKYISVLTGDAAVGLPIGYDGDFGDDVVSVNILDMKFTPIVAKMDAVTALDISSLTGANIDKFILGVTGLSFSPNAMQDRYLYLASDFNILGSSDNLVLKGATNGLNDMEKITYARWGCEGFDELNISLDYKFSESVLTLDKGNGQVVAHSGFKMNKKDGMKWIGEIDIPAFRVVGVPDGYSFEVNKAWLDYSTTSNIVNFENNIPDNYNDSSLKNSDPKIKNTWKGFWMQDLKMHLPDYLTDDNDRVTVDIHNIIYDEKITFSIIVNDILNANEGKSLAGSAFSIEELYMDVVQNSFKKAGLNGKIGLLISDDKLDYSLIYDNKPSNSNIVFNIKPANDVKIPMFLADANIKKTSKFELEINNGAKFSFDINASISISDKYKPANTGILKINMPGIAIEHFKYDTDSGFSGPEFNSQASPQKSMFGFPINFKRFALNTSGKNIVLDMTPSLDLTNAGGSGVSADANVKFISTIDIGASGIKKVKFKKVELKEINVDADISVLHLKGKLAFYEDGDKNGTKGKLKVDFPVVGSVDLAAEFGTYKNSNSVKFGTKDWYDYWFIDGMLTFHNGVPVFIGVSMYGLGGGVSYHMTQGTLPDVTKDITPGKSACNYTNNYQTGLGVSLNTLMGSTDRGTSFNFDVKFTVEFNNDWGLRLAKLTGNVRVLSGGINNIELAPPIGGYVNLEYHNDIGKKHVSGQMMISVYIGDGVVKGHGKNNKFIDAEFYYGSNDKSYFYMGHPSPEDKRAGLDVNVAGLTATFSSYFMMGADIPTELPAPIGDFLSIYEKGGKFKTKGSYKQGHKGKGFAFGASFSTDINGRDLQPIYFYVKFVLGLDINYSYFEGRTCGSDGWYAQGQIYAALEAELGLHIDLYFWEGRVSILNASAALLMKGGFPNPFYAQGSGTIAYSVLGGAIKGSYCFDAEIGEECADKVFAEDILASLKLIQDLQPDDKASKVSVFSSGTAAFTFAVNESFEIPEKERIRYFMPYIYSWDIKKQGGSITVECYNPKLEQNNVVAALMPKGNLEGETNYVQTLAVSVWEIVNNKKQDVYVKGKFFKQSVVNKFRTGKEPDIIVDENVILTYPYKNQKYFLKNETKYGKGYIVLSAKRDDLFNKITSLMNYDYKARFIPINGGAPIESDLEIIDNRILKYDVSSLVNSTTYCLQIIRKAELNSAFQNISVDDKIKLEEYYQGINGKNVKVNSNEVDEKIGLGNQDKYNIDKGDTQFQLSDNNSSGGLNGLGNSLNYGMTGNLDGIYMKDKSIMLERKRTLSEITAIKKNEKKLYEFYFRTSRYNDFKQKLQNPNWDVDMDYVDFLSINLPKFEKALDEPLDYYEDHDYSKTTRGTKFEKGKLINLSFNTQSGAYPKNSYYQYVYKEYIDEPNELVDQFVSKILYKYKQPNKWTACHPIIKNYLPDFQNGDKWNALKLTKTSDTQLSEIDINEALNQSGTLSGNNSTFSSSNVYNFKLTNSNKTNLLLNKIKISNRLAWETYGLFYKQRENFLATLYKKYDVSIHEIEEKDLGAFFNDTIRTDVYKTKSKNLSTIIFDLGNDKWEHKKNFENDYGVKTDLDFNELNSLMSALNRAGINLGKAGQFDFPKYDNGKLRPITFLIKYAIPSYIINPNDGQIQSMRAHSYISVKKEF